MKKKQIWVSKPVYSGDNVDIFWVSNSTELQLPYFPSGINAGFPSPAADFMEETIDLNKYLIKTPSATFIGVAKGLSMIGAGINDGDILIIDKSIKPNNNQIAVCVLDGEFTLKRLVIRDKKLFLHPENEDFEKIDVTTFQEFQIWGIVTFSIIKHF